MNASGMGIGMWLVWIVIILLVVMFIRILFSTDNTLTRLSSESPMDILEKRYAKGEIDDEEFERRRCELEN